MKSNNSKSRNKTEYACATIRSRILDGTYGPGYRLVIDQIAKELQISAIPVREAIRQLEAENLILYKPNVGAVVQLYNEDEYFEVMAMLAVLEGYATAQAAERLSPADVAKLEELNRQCRSAVDNFDFEQYGSLNRQFHIAIIEHCGNSYLKEEIQQVWRRMIQVRKTIFPFVPKRIKSSNEEHGKIIELIKNKASSQEIETFVREHRVNTIKAIRERKEEYKMQRQDQF